jgi:hypothetical protein
MRQLFTPACFDVDFPLVHSRAHPRARHGVCSPVLVAADGVTITLPEDASSREALLRWVHALPDKESPAWLGLPSNAETMLLLQRGAFLFFPPPPDSCHRTDGEQGARCLRACSACTAWTTPTCWPPSRAPLPPTRPPRTWSAAARVCTGAVLLTGAGQTAPAWMLALQTAVRAWLAALPEVRPVDCAAVDPAGGLTQCGGRACRACGRLGRPTPCCGSSSASGASAPGAALLHGLCVSDAAGRLLATVRRDLEDVRLACAGEIKHTNAVRALMASLSKGAPGVGVPASHTHTADLCGRHRSGARDLAAVHGACVGHGRPVGGRLCTAHAAGRTSGRVAGPRPVPARSLLLSGC